MQEKIIAILGVNHKTPIAFKDVTNYNEVYGLYTYKGTVCVLKCGEDIDFVDLTEVEQKKVVELVESKNWILNKALQ